MTKIPSTSRGFLRSEDRAKLLHIPKHQRKPKQRALLQRDEGTSLRRTAAESGISHETVRRLQIAYGERRTRATERRPRKPDPSTVTRQRAIVRAYRSGMPIAKLARRFKRSERTILMALQLAGEEVRQSAKAARALREILDSRVGRTSAEIAAKYHIRLSSIYRHAGRTAAWPWPEFGAGYTDLVGLLIAPPLLAAAVCLLPAGDAESGHHRNALVEPPGQRVWAPAWRQFSALVDEACSAPAPHRSLGRVWLTWLSRLEARLPKWLQVLVLKHGLELESWENYAQAWLSAHPRFAVQAARRGEKWSEGLVRVLRGFHDVPPLTDHVVARGFPGLESYLQGADKQSFWISDRPRLWIRTSISYADWCLRKKWPYEGYCLTRGTLHLGHTTKLILGHWPSPISDERSADEYAKQIAQTELIREDWWRWRIVVQDNGRGWSQRWHVYETTARHAIAGAPVILHSIPPPSAWQHAVETAERAQRVRREKRRTTQHG